MVITGPACFSFSAAMNLPTCPNAAPMAAAISVSPLPLVDDANAIDTAVVSTISTLRSAKSAFGIPSASFLSPSSPFAKSLPTILSIIRPK